MKRGVTLADFFPHSFFRKVGGGELSPIFFKAHKGVHFSRKLKGGNSRRFFPTLFFAKGGELSPIFFRAHKGGCICSRK